jgi:hypothetical protein
MVEEFCVSFSEHVSASYDAQHLCVAPQSSGMFLVVFLVLVVAFVVAYLRFLKAHGKKPEGKVIDGKFKKGTLPADAYDAVVVGAGPSGSVLGYFASKAGVKVILLLIGVSQPRPDCSPRQGEVPP